MTKKADKPKKTCDELRRIIAVVGPTSSGKSDLAVDIAREFSGEVVSADSRQVYRGLDIGSGKITKKEMRGVSHHLLDTASPKRAFSVVQYQKQAGRAIRDILSREKVPILCGGTGYYIDAVTKGLHFHDVPPNKPLQKKLERKTTVELLTLLKKLDPKRARTIDQDNPRRLIRAIEIATTLGHVPMIKNSSPFDTLVIGIQTPDDILKERIHNRLLKRMRAGMLAESKRLHEGGLSYKRMESLGLEYKHLAWLLQDKVTKPEMLELLETASWHYAKRQKTWFKRDARIQWVTLDKWKKTEKLVRDFLISG